MLALCRHAFRNILGKGDGSGRRDIARSSLCPVRSEHRKTFIVSPFCILWRHLKMPTNTIAADSHAEMPLGTAIAVTHASIRDVPEMAALHAQTNPRSYLTLLGAPVLLSMYRHFTRSSYGIALVAKDAKGRMAGVAIGCERPHRFYRGLGLAMLPAYAWSLISQWFAQGSSGVGPAKRYRHQNNLFPRQDIVYFTQLNVAPTFQKLRVGSTLARAIYDEAIRRGYHSVYLITDRDNAPMRALQAKMGCKLVDQFTTPAGIQRCLYLKELGPDQRRV